jgi:MFS family permease
MKHSRYFSKIPKGFKSTFRSLKYHNFRLFFGGQSISLIGTWMQRIAMPWLVYDISHSVILLGVVGFAGQIPTFLLASFGGVITDRWNRYHILIVTQILAMIQALLLALLFYTGVLQVSYILLLSVFLGCINAFDTPARQSFLIEMVENKEDLPNAIALNSTMANGARLLGPSIAGVLIALIGEGACFLINGLSYIVVIISLMNMKIVPRKINPVKKDIFREMKEGYNYTFGFPPLKYVILLLALISLWGMPYTVLMPVFAKEIFHGGPHVFGFLMGAAGMGALLGAIYLASRKTVLGLEKLIPFSAALFGAGLIAFSLSRFLWLSLILVAIVGLGMMLQMASSNTIIQTVAEDNMRGRVMSFYTMAFFGMAPFGSLLAGSMAKVFGAPMTLSIGGIVCIVAAIYFAFKLPVIKKTILPVYIKKKISNELTIEINPLTELTDMENT